METKMNLEFFVQVIQSTMVLLTEIKPQEEKQLHRGIFKSDLEDICCLCLPRASHHSHRHFSAGYGLVSNVGLQISPPLLHLTPANL